MIRRFFVVSAGLLMLTLAWYSGTHDAHAQTGGAVNPTEVATLSGVISNGETIPLPVYSDGSTALESECRWLVSTNLIGCPGTSYAQVTVCNTTGRVVNSYCEFSSGGGPTGVPANYLIIATRGSGGATPAHVESMGGLKAKYR